MSIPKKYLTEKVILIESRVDGTSILKILTQSKLATLDDAKTLDYYKELATWANSNQKKTGKIDLNTIQLSDRSLIKNGKLNARANDLGQVLSTLKNLMDREGKYNPNNVISKLVQKTTLEILVSLSKKNTATPVVDNTKLFEGMDWTAEKARRLAKPAGKTVSEILDQFYNDYYKIEYAGLKSPEDNDTTGIVNKLKSLDKVLIQEFTKLGYNPDVNPLAQFIKNIIKYKPDIFEKLNTNNYGAIHNSFVKQYITGNMLGNYDVKNILFCSDLYNHNGLTIVKYLSLYKQTIDSAKSSTEFANDPYMLAAKMFIQQKQRGTTYAENIKELLADNDNIELPTSDNAKMRSELEISELYNHIFKTVPKKQLDIDSIIDRAKNDDLILDMISYLLNQAELEKNYPEQVSELEDWLDKTSYKRNNNKIKYIRKILLGYTISVANAAKLLKKLVVEYEKAERNK